MARGTVFVTNHVKRKQIKDDYWYSYLAEGDKKLLRIYKQEEMIFQQEATIGDAFEVIIKNGKKENAFITPMKPPKKDWEAIAWLLGFSKHERASTYEEYTKLLDSRRKVCEKSDYVESVLDGPKFEFIEYRLVDDETNQYHNLACWVDENITKNEIYLLIPEFIYPEQYVRKVLSEKFGITAEEFDRALSVFE